MCKLNATITVASRPFLYDFTVTRGSEPVPYRAFLHEWCRYPYDKKLDYPYPQLVEQDIVRALGAVYGPYTGTCFASQAETDIKHIVAASEAHDSGLCARGRETKRMFANDLRNLTLTAPD